ncbi:3694_t:CDS:10, partial [Dentiscutata erythropus]
INKMISHKKITNPERSLSESAVVETTISIISSDIDSSPKPEKNNNDNDLDGSNKITNEVATYGSLCNFRDLPYWCQDNRDIVSGYRRPTLSYLKCAYSLFYIHNEFRAIIFICLAFTTHFYVLSRQSTITWQDFFVLYMFLAGAMVCLGLSSIFHVLCCHSERVCANWNRCDYIGIVFLIVGSLYPMIYYGFFCNDSLKIFYLSLITVLGIATTCLAVSPKFRYPQFRWFRTLLFLAMGLSAVIPMTHAVVLYGVELCFFVISLKWLLLTGILYIAGALAYGARIPERWYPGKFDICGSSHQIFHLFVVAAALVHYYGVVQSMIYWHKENYECSLDIKSMKI